jgi:hypothetical protein
MVHCHRLLCCNKTKTEVDRSVAFFVAAKQKQGDGNIAIVTFFVVAKRK